MQDKGLQRERFELTFERITQSDRDTALVFFNAVKKSFGPFEYQDAEGTLHNVRWLNKFEFSTNLDAGIFIISGIAAFVIAGLTISVKSFQAASTNPVETLSED